jgi:hypothetical protein
MEPEDRYLDSFPEPEEPVAVNRGSRTSLSFWRILRAMLEKKRIVDDLIYHIYRCGYFEKGSPEESFLTYVSEKRLREFRRYLPKTKDREVLLRIAIDKFRRTVGDCIHDGYIKRSSDGRLTVPRKGRELVEGIYWFELMLQKYERFSAFFSVIFGATIGSLMAQGLIWFFSRLVS